MARKNGQTISEDLEELQREIGKLMEDLETRVGRLNEITRRGMKDAAAGASEYVAEKAAGAGEYVSEKIAEAGERVRGSAHAVSDEAVRMGGDAIRRIEDEVGQRPLLTLAIAAGIGFLAGMANRRH